MKRALFCLSLAFSIASFSQTRTVELFHTSDPRGAPELTLCTQNLHAFGLLAAAREFRGKVTNDELRAQERALLSRFAQARCDLIAVQELTGKGREEAVEVARNLARALAHRTGRPWDSIVGHGEDRALFVGFLFATDRTTLLHSVSYREVELPPLVRRDKPAFFQRAPLEIQLAVRHQGDLAPKNLTVVNIHYKSQAGQGDGSGLQFETTRMEMAEATRRVVLDRHQAATTRGELLLAVVGDRNSHFDTASAAILSGALSLPQFRENGGCRLSLRGVPLCRPGNAKPPLLHSVLTLDPQTKNLPGTFLKGRVFSWLDDILLADSSLPFARATPTSEGDYDSGLVASFPDASDHALAFTRFNW